MRKSFNLGSVLTLGLIALAAVFGVADTFISLEFLRQDIPYEQKMLAQIRLIILGFTILVFYSALADWTSFIIFYGIYGSAITVLVLVTILINIGDLYNALGGFEVFSLLSIIPAPYLFSVKSLYKKKTYSDDQDILIETEAPDPIDHIPTDQNYFQSDVIDNNFIDPYKSAQTTSVEGREAPDNTNKDNEPSLPSPENVVAAKDDSKSIVDSKDTPSNQGSLYAEGGRESSNNDATDEPFEAIKPAEKTSNILQARSENSAETTMSNLRYMAGLETDKESKKIDSLKIESNELVYDNEIKFGVSGGGDSITRVLEDALPLDTKTSESDENQIVTIGRKDSLKTLYEAGLIGEAEYKLHLQSKK